MTGLLGNGFEEAALTFLRPHERVGGERCGNEKGEIIPAGTVERGERSRTAAEVSKALGHLSEARAAGQAGLALELGLTLRRFLVSAPSDNPTIATEGGETTEPCAKPVCQRRSVGDGSYPKEPRLSISSPLHPQEADI